MSEVTHFSLSKVSRIPAVWDFAEKEVFNLYLTDRVSILALSMSPVQDLENKAFHSKLKIIFKPVSKFKTLSSADFQD